MTDAFQSIANFLGLSVAGGGGGTRLAHEENGKKETDHRIMAGQIHAD
ncbi:MAG: hypothetical protein ABSG78_18360 [Verrucomicrobiota bacterium]|jgi:hypothetical protein